MEIFAALLTICAGNSPVPGEFLAQSPVTRIFDILFDMRLNKRLSKRSWFETPSCPLWLHSNEDDIIDVSPSSQTFGVLETWTKMNITTDYTTFAGQQMSMAVYFDKWPDIQIQWVCHFILTKIKSLLNDPLHILDDSRWARQSYHMGFQGEPKQTVRCVSSTDPSLFWSSRDITTPNIAIITKSKVWTYLLSKGGSWNNSITPAPLSLMTSQSKDIVNHTQKSKKYILWRMVSTFYEKFQRCPLKFSAQILTHILQNMYFTGYLYFDSLWYLKSYDILRLNETGFFGMV